MQVSEVYNMMKSWERDPCWDLEDNAYMVEYAPYRQILLDFAQSIRDKRAKACKPTTNYKNSKANFDNFIMGKGYLLIKRTILIGSYVEYYLTPQSTTLVISVNNDEYVTDIFNAKFE